MSWVIGFLFALGYTKLLFIDMKWYQRIGYALLLFGLWPVFLGSEFVELTESKKGEV
jgi:hypothetical protein